MSDSTGRYYLRSVPGGSQTIRIRKIGYVPADVTVTVGETEVTAANAAMHRPITKLDTLRVKADNPWHKPDRLMNTTKYDEFYERKTMVLGGVQLTHDELERRVAGNITEALSSIQAIKLKKIGSHYFPQIFGCRTVDMSVYVDNQLVYPFSGMIPDRIHGGAPAKLGDDSPLDALTTLDLSQVEAIEVYKGVTGMPAVARGDSCAAIFIWTR